MDITIRGRNTHVSESLKQATKEKLSKLDRFARGHGRIEVDFFEQRNPRIHDHHEVEVIVHLKGHLVKGHAASTDHFAALDLVIDKVEHQVTRLKERKVDRKHRPRRKRLTAPPLIDDWDEGILAAPEAAENGNGHAEIIRTKQLTAKPMTVEEASLQMDLLGHDFYLFKDAQTGHATVLYRRRDGHLGLIEAVG